MIKSLMMLKYDREVSPCNKTYWEKDEDLNQALWEEAGKVVDRFVLSKTQTKEALDYQVTLVYDLLSELIEGGELE